MEAEAFDPSEIYTASVGEAPTEVDEDTVESVARDGRLARLEYRGIGEDAPALLPSEGLAYWCKDWAHRTEQDYDVVVLVTGEVGDGKSSFVLQAAKKTEPSCWPPDRLCYSPRDLLRAYETVQPGQVIWFDEGVRGLMSTETFSPDQRALVQMFALIRSKRAILFICAPSIWLIAKAVRNWRGTHWVHVTGRGTARIHVRMRGVRYRRDDELRFRTSEVAPSLEWDRVPKNSSLWRAYQREKDRHLSEWFEETKALLEGKVSPAIREKIDRLARQDAQHRERTRRWQAKREAEAEKDP